MLKHVPTGKNFLVDAISCMSQFHSKKDDVVQALVPGEYLGDRVARNDDKPSGWEVGLREALQTVIFGYRKTDI